jgi:hypothetical protein
MDDPQTCGRGLAQRAALAARLSALSAAMAENLEQHQQTLDLSDDHARKEKDAYAVLAKDYRNIASQLQATADRMVSYRDLPMARHDGRALAAPRIREAFAAFIERERDLILLLETWIQQDQEILTQMTGPAGA